MPANPRKKQGPYKRGRPGFGPKASPVPRLQGVVKLVWLKHQLAPSLPRGLAFETQVIVEPEGLPPIHTSVLHVYQFRIFGLACR